MVAYAYSGLNKSSNILSLAQPDDYEQCETIKIDLFHTTFPTYQLTVSSGFIQLLHVC